jgi:hypothetical protein
VYLLMLINNKLKVCVYATPLISLEYVVKLHWDKELGCKIRDAREEKYLSRRALIKMLCINYHPKTFTEPWLDKLEKGKFDTIEVGTALILLSALGKGLDFLYPVLFVSSATNESSE